MSATVTSIAPVKTVKRVRNTASKRVVAAKPSKPTIGRKQLIQGAVVYGVGATLLALSLDHLADGIATTMHLPLWQSAIMALAVDVGFVSTEFMPFTCSAATLTDTRHVRHGFAGAMWLASGFLNATSIGHDWTAFLAGYAIPSVIATCLYLGSRCVLGRGK